MMEDNNSKPLNEKNIVEKHTIDKQFKYLVAMLDLENRIKDQQTRIEALEDAMRFFVEWYNTTQRVDILVPDSVKNEIDGKSKIILG